MALNFIIFGGGGKVSKLFTSQAVKAGHKVNSVIKDNGHEEELKALGATTHILPLDKSTVPSISSLFNKVSPDVVLFAAGAGGKPPGPEEIDHKGAVKVFDAMEEAGIKRLILIGAVAVRSKDSPVPDWYNDQDKDTESKFWKGLGTYMEAKLAAELNLHKRTAIDYTVLRPGSLTTEPAGGVQLGRTHLTPTSRELVAQTALAVATTPGTEGLTIDVVDGSGELKSELKKVVDGKINSWVG
ncbi:hypothetical protein L202_02681 [Cryptococcus amylolentus CBS 6039]|uniref:NAD(P)-binding domain-containing protein n=2 Tax=Cryptococcus amylolentus TaxID=104669 RepID=A0A1E3HXD5_9TREE|nr:hypothetical protein L202_02681 [Cryptococcus amylolentus CBS 6039]ODN80436.1 hypothetical protein L202_02681 [Cryptococcus amylolentus CBS 6039]ODO09060.1 hypothetical protein I350_02659 [Cryptococcus amylolentus CBS 6273]